MTEQINYIYKSFGDFWVGNRNYQIEVPIPVKYDTAEKAKTDNSSLRFEKRDGRIVLVIYSDWKQGMNDGKWYEYVAGNVLDVIYWEEWYKYKISIAKEEGNDNLYDPNSCYVPSATNWDELFDVENLEDNWSFTVESLAYAVFAYF